MQIFTSVKAENFVAFQQQLDWQDHGSLNVIIGENDTGKTHLLKLLYAMARAMEDYAKKRAGPEPKDLPELLANKLRWTFLPQKLELGRLVSRGSGNRLSVTLGWNSDGNLRFGFGKDTVSKILEFQRNNVEEMNEKKSTFLPPKEILSIYDAIVATREGAEIAAFDDTYYDLLQDFRQPLVRGKLQQNINTAINHLEDVTGGGEIDLDSEGIWFQRGKERFNMHQTAEGIKKIGILSRLMRNRRISPMTGCLLFVDEPEVNLHPRAVILFAEMLHQFAQSGIQVYLTTHSYFLLKRLEQLARRHAADYTLLDLRRQAGAGVVGIATHLAEGLPDNPIIQQSLMLFDEDVRLDLGE